MSESFGEAPFSWNTRYLDFRGFEAQVTIRSANLKDLLSRIDWTLDYLIEHKAQPVTYKNSEVNGLKANGDRRGNNAGSQCETKVCPIHHAEMKLRHGKGGDAWHSHKAINPETGHEYWCKGKTRNS